jgi:drug/metabolite transporter (DMT)-like permease
MLISTTATFLHFTLTRPFTALLQPWPVYAYGATMALVCTVLPVFAQSAAIRRIGGGESALIGMAGPLLTIFFAAILLDEPVSMMQAGGLVLVIAGMAVVIWQPSAAAAKPACD